MYLAAGFCIHRIDFHVPKGFKYIRIKLMHSVDGMHDGTKNSTDNSIPMFLVEIFERGAYCSSGPT